MESITSNPTVFLLVRHAETIWNLEKRHTGSIEVPLSDKADRQIMKLTKKMIHQPATSIFASPLSRCQLTIRPTADLLHLPITVRHELIERNLGDWEGKSPNELAPLHPNYIFPQSAYNGDFRIPKAETLEAIETRLRFFLHEAHFTYPGETLIVSTHSGVIWTILHRIVTNPPDYFFWPSNCSVTTVISEGNHFLFKAFEA